MNGRRNLSKKDIYDNYHDKFNILVRFMIVAAENKRFVTYAELNKILGVSIEDLRDFAGLLGDFCHELKLPYLNSLIINSTEGMPGGDYFSWLGENNGAGAWGKHVAHCFSSLHLSTSNKKKFLNTSGLNETVDSFFNNS